MKRRGFRSPMALSLFIEPRLLSDARLERGRLVLTARELGGWSAEDEELVWQGKPEELADLSETDAEGKSPLQLLAACCGGDGETAAAWMGRAWTTGPRTRTQPAAVHLQACGPEELPGALKRLLKVRRGGLDCLASALLNEPPGLFAEGAPARMPDGRIFGLLSAVSVLPGLPRLGREHVWLTGGDAWMPGFRTCGSHGRSRFLFSRVLHDAFVRALARGECAPGPLADRLTVFSAWVEDFRERLASDLHVGLDAAMSLSRGLRALGLDSMEDVSAAAARWRASRALAAGPEDGSPCL